MSKTKKRVKDILTYAAELYDTDYYSKTAQHLSQKELKAIVKELKDIADKKNNKLIKLTKFLKPLVIPTAKRITLESNTDFSKLNNGKSVVVYMPNHKSHLDEFIIGYTLLTKHLPVPVTAAGENLFKNKFSGFMLKSYGAFKIRRDKYSNDEHYSRLLSSYLGASIIKGNHIMTFQEGTRPRDGKIGLFRKGIIGTIEKLFRDMKDRPEFAAEDITFVPIAINWSENPDEKKMTADSEATAEDTDLFKRFLNLKKTHSSKDIRGVYLGFGNAVSYNQFVAENNPDENNSYAIGICNEVRSRVVGMMPIFKEHLLHSSIQFLNKYNNVVITDDCKRLIDVTQNIISNDEHRIKMIETEGYSIENQLELMEQRGIIKFNDEKSGFTVRKPSLIDYYANQVTSLIEERKA